MWTTTRSGNGQQFSRTARGPELVRLVAIIAVPPLLLIPLIVVMMWRVSTMAVTIRRDGAPHGSATALCQRSWEQHRAGGCR